MMDARRRVLCWIRSISCAALVAAVAYAAAFAGARAAPAKHSVGKRHRPTIGHQVTAPVSITDRRDGGVVKAETTASMFAIETAMNAKKLIGRWKIFVEEASKRTRLPSDWIRAVLMEESGGRTMMAENTPIKSSMGAMGLMQLMPATWNEMKTIYKLGSDPNDPRDNILAGAAYLRILYWEYGYPGMFAAYNDGPGMIEAHRRLEETLPNETGMYVLDIASILRTGARGGLRYTSPLFRPATTSDDGDREQEVVAAPAQSRYSEDNDDDYYHEQAPTL
jgi:soluble lytic murein transglycosylase-like protein